VSIDNLRVKSQSLSMHGVVNHTHLYILMCICLHTWCIHAYDTRPAIRNMELETLALKLGQFLVKSPLAGLVVRSFFF
jgi:hypothetical protein